MMKLIAFSLCIIGLLTELSSSAPSPAVIEDEELNYRLNTDIEPINYIIDVTPYFDDKTSGKQAFTFDGIVIITLKSNESNVTRIVLHKQDMDIKWQTLTKVPENDSNVENIPLTSDNYDNITKKYTIELSNALIKDEIYMLKFEYTGKLQTDMLGFYRSSYKEGNETK